MCDYSLQHDVRSRNAAAGDKLVLGRYGPFRVRAFGRAEDGECVTCLPFGAKLEVVRPGQPAEAAYFGHNDGGLWRDGLIFASSPNAVVSLQKLEVGATATVLALPRSAPARPRMVVEASDWVDEI